MIKLVDSTGTIRSARKTNDQINDKSGNEQIHFDHQEKRLANKSLNGNPVADLIDVTTTKA